MAVVNTLDASISNPAASPVVLNDARNEGGYGRHFLGTVEVAAADDDTSTYRLLTVKSNMVLLSLSLLNDAITAGTSYDFGLYYNSTKLAGVVVPNCVALFASAVDLSAAHGATGALDITYEATATNIDSLKKRLWELAGLTSDPDCLFDIVATANTVGSSAGTISLRGAFLAGG